MPGSVKPLPQSYRKKITNSGWYSFLNISHRSFTGKLIFSKMILASYIFKSFQEAKHFLAILVRMIKLCCRKKLTLKISLTL